MISNVNNSIYLQTNEVKNNSRVGSVDSSSRVESNSRVSEIKKAIENGSYQLLPTSVLSKIFVDAELGIPN
jgi:anti-sigma28 factor (negative regulator of flagellin synthesis)